MLGRLGRLQRLGRLGMLGMLGTGQGQDRALGTSWAAEEGLWQPGVCGQC